MNAPHEDAVRPRRRRKYLIDPGFQWKQAGAISLAVFLLSTSVSAVLYGVLHQQARQLAANPASYRPATALVMVCFGIGFAALTSGGVGLWSIHMTHRICGPMFVIKRYLVQIAAGHLPVLRPLRRRDEFKDVYDALDKAIQSLRERKTRELSQVSEALEAANRAMDGEGVSAQDGLEAVVSRLEWLRSRAEETLAEVHEKQEQAPSAEAAVSARHAVAP
jgi:methyl-accepting chemotaxis protein